MNLWNPSDSFSGEEFGMHYFSGNGIHSSFPGSADSQLLFCSLNMVFEQ